MPEPEKLWPEPEKLCVCVVVGGGCAYPPMEACSIEEPFSQEVLSMI